MEPKEYYQGVEAFQDGIKADKNPCNIDTGGSFAAWGKGWFAGLLAEQESHRDLMAETLLVSQAEPQDFL